MVNLCVSFLTILLADITTPKDIDPFVDQFVVAHSNRQPR